MWRRKPAARAPSTDADKLAFRHGEQRVAWLCYPITVREDAGFARSDLQEHLESVGIDTRTVWSGNVTRHPMMRGVEYRVPADGLPNADEVFERGMSLGMSHGMRDVELNHVVKSVHEFAGRFAPGN
jgi:CDP-6-deoxy-D-xylo-4-hexulose-3-dehydrase